MSTLAHLIRCHRILSNRRTPIPFAELQQRLECSTATLKRVLTQLEEEFGAPLIRARSHGVFYARDAAVQFELPGFWLNAGELTALLVFENLLQGTAPGVLSEQLAPIRSKARALLGAQAALPDWPQRLRLLGATRREAGSAFGTVASALVRRRRLSVRYHGRESDEITVRELSPQRLTHYRDRWYLDAWCHTRNALRSFAVERLGEARELPTPAQEEPASALDAVLASSYGIFSGAATHTAELLFSPKAARWVADEQWHPAQVGERRADGSWHLRFPYHRDEELVMDLLRHGEDVEVIGPPALRKAVAARLKAALAQYEK
ncbi:MAG: WYL domain-containing transcriptional regulator [Stagnimonas sp.]|nr:WYL domain-containing transcriptional regulator [Stagnimonas sp.]